MPISFSVIMPTFNRKHCIKNAIDSLLGQTYQNFELIIIDDGSTDGTNEYLKELYAEELNEGRIKYVQFFENKGAAFARNEGLKMAKNNWIGYLDTDNLMRREFLETFCKAIENNPSNFAFYAQVKNMQSGLVIGHEFDFEKLLYCNYIDLGVFIHARKIFSEIGYFNTNLRRLIDWELILKCVRKYLPIFIEKVLLDYYDGSQFFRITTGFSYGQAYKRMVMGYYENISNEEFCLLHQERFLKIQKEREITYLKEVIQEKNREIEVMKISKLWKIWKALWKTRPAIIVNKYIFLSRQAKEELKLGGLDGLMFALKRHIKKKLGKKLLTSYPQVNDYEKNLVSVIILSKDRLDLIKPCLLSIFRRGSDKYQFEVIVGDTGSQEKNVWKFYRRIKRKHKNFELVRLGKYFFSQNYNYLIENFARGEYVVFLNNDTFVKRDWLDELVGPLEDRQIGIVGAKLLYKDDTIQHAGIEFSPEGFGQHVFSKEKKDLPEADFPAEVPAVTFACAAMRHDVFDRFKLSEEYEEEAQDTDICMRLRKSKFKIVYNPKSKVYHFECSSRDWRKGEADRKLLRERWGKEIEGIFKKGKQRIPFGENDNSGAIVVLRDDGIGDLLMGISALKKLREKNSSKKMILATYERNIEMMEGFGIFDEFIPIPNGQKYTPLPIPTKGTKVYRFIDLEMNFGGEFALTKEDNKVHRHDIFSRDLELDGEYEIVPMPEYSEAKKGIIEKLREKGFNENFPFVAINLISSNPARSWWWPYYKILTEEIRKLGFIPLVLGTQKSGYFDEAGIVNLEGETETIAEYIEAVKIAKYVVSSDTSAYHIAALSGIPFLAIFTGGIPISSRLGYYNKYEALEPKNLSCYPCWDEGCKDLSIRHKNDPCRFAIKPQEVVEKFKILIKKYPR